LDPILQVIYVLLVVYCELTVHLIVSLLQMTFNGIVDNLTCTDCKILIKERIRKLVVDWTMVKTTI
jgi:hypothetical protein